MKGLGRVVIGSAVGGLLGAAAFFAVDGLIPSKVEAQTYGVHITSSGSLADKWIKLTESGSLADKWVRLQGKCSGN